MSVPVAIRTSIAIPPATSEAPPERAKQRDALVLGDRPPRGADRQGEHHHPTGPHGCADQVQRANERLGGQNHGRRGYVRRSDLRVERPVAALGRRQAAALGGDRAALHAVGGTTSRARPSPSPFAPLRAGPRGSRRPAPGTSTPRSARPRAARRSAPGCGSARRRVSRCPTRTPTRACRTCTCRRASGSSSALVENISFSASCSCFQWPPGKAPLVIVIALAIAPPTKKPFENGWRMLRDS